MSHYLPDHPDQPAGVEFDPFLGLPAESEYTEEEAGWFERGKLFVERESGYGEIQLTKPQTLAALVADSPAAQLAWITEKRYFWGLAERGVGTEAFEKVWPKEDLITTAAVYFLTNTGGTSSRYYWECRGNPWSPSHDRFPVVGVPTAVSIYPGEIYKPPMTWTSKYFNLQQYRVHSTGGTSRRWRSRRSTWTTSAPSSGRCADRRSGRHRVARITNPSHARHSPAGPCGGMPLRLPFE